MKFHIDVLVANSCFILTLGSRMTIDLGTHMLLLLDNIIFNIKLHTAVVLTLSLAFILLSSYSTDHFSYASQREILYGDR
jgi:hypothetical protein